MKSIIKQGSGLPQNRGRSVLCVVHPGGILIFPAVESVLEKVKDVLSVAQDWEQKAKGVLKQRYVLSWVLPGSV